MEAKVFVRDEREETNLTTPDQQVEAARQWLASPRFAGIVRLYTPRQVAEQQGTMPGDYTVARRAGDSTRGCASSLNSASRSRLLGPIRPAKRS